jgi:membrane associated rhomboid family serine protease
MDIKAKDKTGYLLLLGLLVKVAHEQFYGASTDGIDLIDASVAINAHLWGAVGGAIFSIVYLGVTSELIGGKNGKILTYRFLKFTK